MPETIPLHRIAESLPALVFVTDAEGRNTYTSARFQAFTGLTAEALNNQGWLAILHPEDQEQVLARWQQAVEQGVPYEAEARFRRHDGVYRWHLCRGEPVLDESGAVIGWLGTCTDLEERKRAEQSLVESESRLTSAIEMAELAVWEYDPLTDLSQGDDRWAGFLDVAPGTLLDTETFFSRLHPDDRPHVRERMQEAVERSGRYDATYRLIRADGSLRWLTVRGRVIGWRGQESSGGYRRIVGTMMDVTERKAAEAVLRASRDELRLVADTATVRLAHVDGNGRYVFTNRAYAEWLECTPTDLVGRRVVDVLAPEVYRLLEPRIEAALAGNLVEFEVDLPLEGEPESVQCTYAPDVDANGEVRGFVGAITDISYRRLLERRLLEADRRKDEFLAVLAHELRNPLAPLRTGLDLLQLTGVTDEVAARAQEMMGRQLTHIVRLVDDLLDLSRITRGVVELKRDNVLAGEVVRRAVEAARPAIAERGHELFVEIPDTPIAVFADAERLTQVVGNLLGNAAKYSDPGGRIWVSLSLQHDEVRIWVRDSGWGIPPEEREAIFEMFRRLEHHGRGTVQGLGVGLAISRQLVALHGGVIEVSSQGRGHGSEFLVRLPAVPAEAVGRAPDVHGDDALTARRVLVVDDNVDAAESLRDLLTRFGQEVRVAYDGRSALSLVKEFPPELALLDIGLPGMDGHELARSLREMPGGQDITLVAITGLGQQQDKSRSKAAGFNSHFTKPVPAEALLALLRDTR